MNEHEILLTKALNVLPLSSIDKILDAGSGRTSLNILTTLFNNKTIDAIIFPGDERKRNSIKEKVINTNYCLIEYDLCKSNITEYYDLVVAHLLLGEALTWGNTFENLLNSLFNITSKYYLIYDFLEDPSVKYDYLESYVNNRNYKILFKDTIKKEEPQTFKNFIGKNYICYVITKKE